MINVQSLTFILHFLPQEGPSPSLSAVRMEVTEGCAGVGVFVLCGDWA